MIILGIDPGITNLGLGIIEGNRSEARLVYAGLVKTSHQLVASERVSCIHAEVKRLLQLHKPDAVSVEGQYFYRQNELAYKIGWAVGAVLVASHDAGARVFVYGPQQVKQALVGRGRADKQQVAYMVRTVLRLDKAPTSNHTTDALAIALTHLFHGHIPIANELS